MRAVEDADDLVAVELTEMERRMLFIGLFDWGGPAYCEDSLAQALGFRDVQDLYDEGRPLAEAIGRGEPQSRRNWTRALASLEVMFGSCLLGSGEWSAVHGYDEDARCGHGRAEPTAPWSDGVRHTRCR